MNIIKRGMLVLMLPVMLLIPQCGRPRKPVPGPCYTWGPLTYIVAKTSWLTSQHQFELVYNGCSWAWKVDAITYNCFKVGDVYQGPYETKHCRAV